MAPRPQAIAFVREVDAPRLPPPPGTVGLWGWMRQNLFYNAWSTLTTVVCAWLIASVVWSVFSWAVVRGVWTGDSREACLGVNSGACWPFVKAKFGQWIYGFYPIDQRWRVNIVFLVGAMLLAALLIPRIGQKMLSAVLFLFVFPLFALVMLGGGHFNITNSAFYAVAGFMLVLAVFLPMTIYGLEGGARRNRAGSLLIFLGLLPLLAALALMFVVAILGMVSAIAGWFDVTQSLQGPLQAAMSGLVAFDLMMGESKLLFYASPGLAGVGILLSLFVTLRAGPIARGPVTVWGGIILAALMALLFLRFDFGLEKVDTAQWGGLLVTLVVALTGIVVSLPMGVLLALGRRSTMPVVKYFCVTFIETIRGVPLITVLFMSSVMLPLFLPPGTSFDKLLRALVAVAIFSSAYMAEVVRGGLQAIPKGQTEASQALGLTYWQATALIVMPQALKIVIPGIVNTFISLFKDTTLVTVVGIFDFLGIIVASFSDAKWAAPQTGATGYFFAALVFWVFCFSMSRYSLYIERRLDTGHKRS